MPKYQVMQMSFQDNDGAVYKRRQVVDVPDAIGEYYDMLKISASESASEAAVEDDAADDHGEYEYDRYECPDKSRHGYISRMNTTCEYCGFDGS